MIPRQLLLLKFCIWRRWIAVLLQIERFHFLIFSWLHGHRQTHQMTRNEHTKSAQGCFLTLADTDNTKINTAPVHGSFNKKQKNHPNWKCWITSTMAWYWMTNLDSWTKLLCIDSATYESLVLCYKSHFIKSSCNNDHLQGHQVVINDVAKRFSMILWRMMKWALEVCTYRFPKIGRYRQHKIQLWSVHMNNKQTVLQIWKYWITSTMSWHWTLQQKCNV